MKISKYKVEQSHIQQVLFPDQLGNHGHVRTVVGNLMEELTAKVVSGRRHVNRPGFYCPDVSRTFKYTFHTDTDYFESKSAGRSKQTFVYGGRLLKDEDFSKDHNLFYVVWHHLASTKLAATVDDLRTLVLLNLRKLYIIPFLEMNRICFWLPEERLNSNYGSNHTYPKVYGSGVRVPIALLEPYLIRTWDQGILSVEDITRLF